VITGTRAGRFDVWHIMNSYVAAFGMPTVWRIGRSPRDDGGVDDMARTWCERQGANVKVYDADWDRHGDRAGPIRNAEMTGEAEPGDHLIAWPCEDATQPPRIRESRGTWGTFELGLARGLLCVVAHTSCIRELRATETAWLKRMAARSGWQWSGPIPAPEEP
jgi:hypothetical protein